MQGSDKYFKFSSHKVILLIIWNFWECSNQGILKEREKKIKCCHQYTNDVELIISGQLQGVLYLL